MLKRFIAVSLCIFSLFISGTALAIEFSADTVTTTGEFKTSGKIYFSDDKFRMDINAPQTMTMITRRDKNVVWNVMHDQKMYMEIPLREENRPRVEKEFEGEIERKLLGKETIDGHPTEKYLITYKVRDNTHQVYQWWATDINFPIKTEAVNGEWKQEYKNIKMGKQDDSLFKVPAGYEKFDMPGGMMMPGGMKTR
jgi:hypothetical protein